MFACIAAAIVKAPLPLLSAMAHAGRISASKKPGHRRLSTARLLTESVSSHVCLGGQRTTGMDIGLMMDGDYREGQTQGEAFDDVLRTADLDETLCFDGVWLAERH